MTNLAPRILAEIDRRLAVIRAATPGPWVAWDSPDPFAFDWCGLQQASGGCVATLESQLDDVDAAFIAASRNEREGELLAIRLQVERLAACQKYDPAYDLSEWADGYRACVQHEASAAADELREIAARLGVEEVEEK